MDLEQSVLASVLAADSALTVLEEEAAALEELIATEGAEESGEGLPRSASAISGIQLPDNERMNEL